MTLGAYLRRLDWLLVAAIGGLLAFGWSTMDALARSGSSPAPAGRHAIYVLIGVALGVAVSAIDPRLWRRLLWPAYGLTAVLLVIVLGFAAARGAQSWIPLPFFNLQPSELAKLVLALALACVVARRERARPGAWSTVGVALGITAPLFALVFIQPDLGTSVIFVAILLSILLVAGTRPLPLLLLVGSVAGAVALVLVALPSAGVRILQDYQVARLTSFLDPAADSTGAGYQQVQSMTVIGSGGIDGAGVGSVGTAADYLPEEYTDFIFAVIAHERGFVGAALVLALYALVVWRALRAVAVARSLWESLLAAGLTGMLVAQIFINIAMNMGVAPITGLPLPFLTYGGSNTLVNLVAAGLILAVQLRGTLPEPSAVVERAAGRRSGRRLRASHADR